MRIDWKAEIQFMSFVTPEESDFPSLRGFFDTNDENQKKEIYNKEVMAKMIGSRKLLPVYEFKCSKIATRQFTSSFTYRCKYLLLIIYDLKI